MSEEKVRIGLRLNEKEYTTLKQYAAACGLSVSEFMRRLCIGRIPKPQPPKEFWGLLNVIYELHAAFKSCIPYYPAAVESCIEIEQLIVDLQREITIERGV